MVTALSLPAAVFQRKALLTMCGFSSMPLLLDSPRFLVLLMGMLGGLPR